MRYRDAFGGIIELTEERWKHITKEHPEVRPYRSQIQEVLERPDYVKRSKRDSTVLLYYRFYEGSFNGKYLLVVVKKEKRPFVLTYYITDVIKRGETVWQRK